MTIPNGYCQCGCGQQTKVARSNSRTTRKGQYYRFFGSHFQQYRHRDKPKTCSVCAQSPTVGRGLCRHHYSLWWAYGSTTKHDRKMRSLAERFWSKVDKSGDCWEWQGYSGERGFGQVSTYGRSRLVRNTHPAHRIAWELTRGPIPQGLLVLHHCDNRLCVRPDHLFLGTDADNAADRDTKGRWRNSWLTPGDVLIIRQMHQAGVSTERIALYFDVSRPWIARIARRQAWTHV
jgi:hypothetical protein